jgi:tight adherence protein C
MKWLVFVTLTIWFYLIFAFVTSRRRQMQSRVEDIAPKRVTKPVIPKDGSGISSVRQVARKVATSWIRGWSQSRVEKLQLKLIRAGSPLNLAAAEWIGLRLIAMGIGAVAGGLCVWLLHGQLSSLVLLLVFVLIGWIGPDFWLSKQVQLRQGLLLKQLPSALDLLTVSVEAGLGFDQAISRVAQKMTGPLAEEFDRALREMQLGSQRASALQRLAVRTQLDAIQSFISAIIQADKLGIGMAQVLRVQAAEVRRKRRMDAEERAMKAPVKMLFPLVIFVFPSLFIIILGPALLQIVAFFSGK